MLPSDIEDITIAAAGEPVLNYLAGVFVGIGAEFTYRSAGNGYEVQVTASETSNTRVIGTTGHVSAASPAMRANLAMRARPSNTEHARTRFKTRLRQLDGQHIIDLKVNFRAEASL